MNTNKQTKNATINTKDKNRHHEDKQTKNANAKQKQSNT